MLCPWLKTITTSKPHYIVNNGTTIDTSIDDVTVQSEVFASCQGIL